VDFDERSEWKPGVEAASRHFDGDAARRRICLLRDEARRWRSLDNSDHARKKRNLGKAKVPGNQLKFA
jgi:hypothetical protein